MPAPAPLSLTESAVAEWMRLLVVVNVQRLLPEEVRPFAQSDGKAGWLESSRAVLALVEDRVRETIRLCNERYRTESCRDIMLDDEIVARVMS